MWSKKLMVATAFSSIICILFIQGAPNNITQDQKALKRHKRGTLSWLAGYISPGGALLNKGVELIHKEVLPESRFKCPSGLPFREVNSKLKENLKYHCKACYYETDSCSAPGILAHEVNSNFEASCDIHDYCYGYGGRSKESCDTDFKFNMNKECGTDLICLTEAQIVYEAVSNHKDAIKGYEWGQKKAKTCSKTGGSCNDGEHGIPCCPQYVIGDMEGGSEVEVIFSPKTGASCQNACKEKYPTSVGMTLTPDESRCYCEFGPILLNGNDKSFITCVFSTAKLGCNEGGYNIPYCPEYVTGDLEGGSEVEISFNPKTEASCQNNCKEKHPTSVGVTLTPDDSRCYCEFAPILLNGNDKSYKTCVFSTGCSEGGYHIPYCPEYVTGDMEGGTEVEISFNPKNEADCQNACKEKHPTSVGVTLTPDDSRCYCEFAPILFNGNDKSYKTCVFSTANSVTSSPTTSSTTTTTTTITTTTTTTTKPPQVLHAYASGNCFDTCIGDGCLDCHLDMQKKEEGKNARDREQDKKDEEIQQRGDDGGSDSGCFPAIGLVVLNGEKKKSMEYLHIGDVIMTVENGKLEPTRVLGFLDKKKNSTLPYLNLITKDGNNLFISDRHAMFIRENDVTKSVLAQDIKAGDKVIVNNKNGFRFSEVVKITVAAKTGAYVPLTSSGTLLVDGVLVSSYTNGDHWLAHILATPLRWWPSFLLDTEESQDEEGIRTIPWIIREFATILWMATRAEAKSEKIGTSIFKMSQMTMTSIDKT